MTYTFKIARRMATNHVVRMAPLALVALLVACGGASPTDPTPTPTTPAPVAGWLTIQLDTPHANDGAVQLAVSGPEVEEIAVDAPYTGAATIRNGTAYLVVTGPLADGAVARVRVRDVSRATQYAATVQAAAVRHTYALQQLGAYRAAVVR